MAKETPITLHLLELILRDDVLTKDDFDGTWYVMSPKEAAERLQESLTTHTQELTSQITLLREELAKATETGLKDYEGMREFQAKFIEADKKSRLVDHWKQAFDTEWSINQDLNAQLAEKDKRIAELEELNEEERRMFGSAVYKAQIQAMKPVVKQAAHLIKHKVIPVDTLNKIGGGIFDLPAFRESVETFLKTPQSNELIGE